MSYFLGLWNSARFLPQAPLMLCQSTCTECKHWREVSCPRLKCSVYASQTCDALQVLQWRGQPAEGAPQNPLQCIKKWLGEAQYDEAAKVLMQLLHPNECRRPALAHVKLDSFL